MHLASCRSRSFPTDSTDEATIERAQIDKRRGRLATLDYTAIRAVTEPAAPAVEARRTDRFALAEGFDPHATATEFRQQRLPFVLAAP